MSGCAAAPVLVPILTADEMRAWERDCFDSGRISERVVMESAGRAAAAAIAREYPEGLIVAAVGKGNNGGDAVVALRTLAAAGREVRAVPVTGDPLPPELTHRWSIPTVEPTGDAFSGAAVLLDGILGTGAAGAPREPLSQIIRWMNESGVPIVALDGPSGVDLTTGAVEGEAIQAALTVTFGVLKRGLLLFPGRRFAGRILLAEVGFPPLSTVGAAAVTDRWAHSRIPTVPLDAHKGSVGLVGIVAGREGVGGALIMASMGALRAGCGGVRAFSVEPNRTVVNTAIPEAVFFDRAGPDVHWALADTRALVIGPGMGLDDRALEILRSVISEYPGELVIDADALTLIATNEDMFDKEVRDRCVLTPHPGELARLLGTDVSSILEDRFASAVAAAERYGCVILAKGAPSLIAAPGEPVLVPLTGHSGVAAAGMGDTLAGIVAALLATGASPRDAAALGTHYAGLAAESAGRARGLLPRDVAEAVPSVLFAPAPIRRPAFPFVFDLPPPT